MTAYIKTTPNIHPVTGVRYSCYSLRDLFAEIWEEVIFPFGGESHEQQEARSRAMAGATRALIDLGFSDRAIEDCLDTLSNDFDEHYEPGEEETFSGVTGEVKWELFWLGGAPHLMITESPYFGVGRLCSPCVPNAVNGSTMYAVFTDLDVAYANFVPGSGPYSHNHGVCYAAPPVWVDPEEAQRERENQNSAFEMHPEDM